MGVPTRPPPPPKFSMGLSAGVDPEAARSAAVLDPRDLADLAVDGLVERVALLKPVDQGEELERRSGFEAVGRTEGVVAREHEGVRVRIAGRGRGLAELRVLRDREDASGGRLDADDRGPELHEVDRSWGRSCCIVCSAATLDAVVDGRVDVQSAALQSLLALLGGRAERRIVLDDVAHVLAEVRGAAGHFAARGRRGDHGCDRLDDRGVVLLLRDLAVFEQAAENVELATLGRAVAVSGREVLLLRDLAARRARCRARPAGPR